MTASIGNKQARIVSDGFHLFAHKNVHMSLFILPGVFLMQQPLAPDAIEVFRSFRIGDGKIRHDKCNITFDLIDQATMVLNDIYLTPEFGITVVADTELARFEFQPTSTLSDFQKVFQFKTLDGFKFEPQCFFKLL